MRSILLGVALVMGLADVAAASTGAEPAAQVQDVNLDVNSQADVTTSAGTETPALVPVQERREPARERGLSVGQGDLPWILSGAMGALVPLVLFAVPALVLVWFGPLAPMAFLAAIAVGTVATGLGGALAWMVSAIFSNTKSGFFLPILYSSMVGMAMTFLSGMGAALAIWTGVGLAYLVGGARNIQEATRPNFDNPFGSMRSGILVSSAVIATFIWGAGVVMGSIAGPMLAAFTYRMRGEPKRVAAPSMESPSGGVAVPAPRQERLESAPPQDRDYYRGNQSSNTPRDDVQHRGATGSEATEREGRGMQPSEQQEPAAGTTTEDVPGRTSDQPTMPPDEVEESPTPLQDEEIEQSPAPPQHEMPTDQPIPPTYPSVPPIVQ